MQIFRSYLNGSILKRICFRVQIRNDLKGRIQIRRKFFQIYNTAKYSSQKLYFLTAPAMNSQFLSMKKKFDFISIL